jgi:hypothetical protein
MLKGVIRRGPRRSIAGLVMGAALALVAGACQPSDTRHSETTDTLTTSKRVKDTTVVKKDVTVKTDTLKTTDHTKP